MSHVSRGLSSPCAPRESGNKSLFFIVLHVLLCRLSASTYFYKTLRISMVFKVEFGKRLVRIKHIGMNGFVVLCQEFFWCVSRFIL